MSTIFQIYPTPSNIFLFHSDLVNFGFVGSYKWIWYFLDEIKNKPPLCFDLYTKAWYKLYIWFMNSNDSDWFKDVIKLRLSCSVIYLKKKAGLNLVNNVYKIFIRSILIT